MPGVVRGPHGDDVPQPPAAAAAGRPGTLRSRRRTAARSRADQRAGVPGRADSRRRGRSTSSPRPKRSRRSWSTTSRCRSWSIRFRRSAPADRTRAPKATSTSAAGQDYKWTEAEARRSTPAACRFSRRAGHVAGRRRRRGLQERGLHPRRERRSPVHVAPAARAADGDGVLAERQAVPARLDAVGRADGSERRALGRHRASDRSC